MFYQQMHGVHWSQVMIVTSWLCGAIVKTCLSSLASLRLQFKIWKVFQLHVVFLRFPTSSNLPFIMSFQFKEQNVVKQCYVV